MKVSSDNAQLRVTFCPISPAVLTGSSTNDSCAEHCLPAQRQKTMKCGKLRQEHIERANSCYFFRANQKQAGSKIYSWTQCSLSVKECDWHVLAGNDEWINSHCLTRNGFKCYLKRFQGYCLLFSKLYHAILSHCKVFQQKLMNNFIQVYWSNEFQMSNCWCVRTQLIIWFKNFIVSWLFVLNWIVHQLEKYHHLVMK